MIVAPIFTAAIALQKLNRVGDIPYLFIIFAFLVSVPLEILNMIGSSEYQWVGNHFLPGIQLGLFAAAIGRMPAALLVAFVTYAFTLWQFAIIDFLEPNTLGIVAGSMIVIRLAWGWKHNLRPVILIYCLGGMITWLLWMLVRTEYGVLNTLAYLGHQSIQLISMGLFVHVVWRKRLWVTNEHPI